MDVDLTTPLKLTLVDDVLTKGSTAIGAAWRILHELPQADVKVFSVFRTCNFVPEIDDLKGLMFIIGARKLKGYAVGVDNRSRAALSMYGQTSGRTNISTAISPYGAPRYIRTIMHPDKNKCRYS